MRFLDALVPSRRGEVRDTRPYSLEQFVQDVSFGFGGQMFGAGAGAGVQTSYGRNPAEPIGGDFVSLVQAGLKGCGPVAAVEDFRVKVLSEARFVFQRLQGGRPGDIFGSQDLALLERPWVGGTTGDLIAKMVQHADFAGNAFAFRAPAEVVLLRPDWVDIVLEKRILTVGGRAQHVGWSRLAYAYWEGGRAAGGDPVVFAPTEVAHFAPIPDPLSSWRGMSWLTPVVREIQADGQAARHKSAFLENAATPNLAVSLDRAVRPEQFKAFKAEMDKKHRGPSKAGSTLYLGGGADVTVIGKDMRELDFGSLVGKGETRIANAGGIHPVVLGFSEALAGSGLSVGAYVPAKRMTTDRTLRPLWRNLAGSLQVLFPPPAVGLAGQQLPPARLWYDARDVAFLRDDAQDVAQIQQAEAAIIASLTMQGYTSESIVAAVLANDWKLLVHSGLYSVQLQPAGSGQPAVTASARAALPAGDFLDIDMDDNDLMEVTR
jgi:hypothetical protein